MTIRVRSLCLVGCISIILTRITNAENPVEEAVLQGIHVESSSFVHIFLENMLSLLLDNTNLNDQRQNSNCYLATSLKFELLKLYIRNVILKVKLEKPVY